ncbi:hypothetical protein ACFWR5_14820, partial [Streptomyces sp. NPDC058613]
MNGHPAPARAGGPRGLRRFTGPRPPRPERCELCGVAGPREGPPELVHTGKPGEHWARTGFSQEIGTAGAASRPLR